MLNEVKWCFRSNICILLCSNIKRCTQIHRPKPPHTCIASAKQWWFPIKHKTGNKIKFALSLAAQSAHCTKWKKWHDGISSGKMVSTTKKVTTTNHTHTTTTKNAHALFTCTFVHEYTNKACPNICKWSLHWCGSRIVLTPRHRLIWNQYSNHKFLHFFFCSIFHFKQTLETSNWQQQQKYTRIVNLTWIFWTTRKKFEFCQ